MVVLIKTGNSKSLMKVKMQSKNYSGTNLTKYLLAYHIAVFCLFAATYFFSKSTYPIAALLVGFGRFDDWWGTIYAVLKYPESTWGICTVPWMHIAFLKPLGAGLGPYLLHVLYILLFILVITPAYQYLSDRIGKLNSVLIIFTYPLIFAFWRGNTDLIIFGLILCGCFAYRENRIRNSLIWFGVAATFKPFALLYLMVFRFRDLLDNYKIILTGAVIVVALILLGNANFFNSLAAFGECGKYYTDSYIIGDGGTLHNNSIWGLFKFFLYTSFDDLKFIKEIVLDFSLYIKIWPILAVLLFFGMKSGMRTQLFESDKVSSSIFLLSLISVLLLPVSPDYRLYLVSLSLILICINKVSSRYSKSFITICLLLILLPKHVLWLSYGEVNFTLNAPLNAILIISLLVYLFSIGLSSERSPARAHHEST